MLDLNNLKELYIGKTYNYLTVIDVYREYNTIFFTCKCICGKVTNIRKTRVINNVSKSYGCYRKSKEFSDRQRQWSKNHQDITDRNVKALRQWHSGDQLRKKDAILKNDYSELLNILHPKYHEDFLCGYISSNSIVETTCPICNCYAEHKLKHVFMFKSRTLRRNHQTMRKSCAANLTMSHYEQEIADYISTFYQGECIRNSRDIISPLELDLYYPEKKIAIEYNGDYWHSEEFKQKDYHYNKFKLCLENNILLVSVFEASWNNDKQSIKQYIIDLFNGVDNDISFVNDKQLVNNNYPSPSKPTTLEFIDECYSINNLIVYTCGYSVL